MMITVVFLLQSFTLCFSTGVRSIELESIENGTDSYRGKTLEHRNKDRAQDDEARFGIFPKAK